MSRRTAAWIITYIAGIVACCLTLLCADIIALLLHWPRGPAGWRNLLVTAAALCGVIAPLVSCVVLERWNGLGRMHPLQVRPQAYHRLTAAVLSFAGIAWYASGTGLTEGALNWFARVWLGSLTSAVFGTLAYVRFERRRASGRVLDTLAPALHRTVRASVNETDKLVWNAKHWEAAYDAKRARAILRCNLAGVVGVVTWVGFCIAGAGRFGHSRQFAIAGQAFGPIAIGWTAWRLSLSRRIGGARANCQLDDACSAAARARASIDLARLLHWFNIVGSANRRPIALAISRELRRVAPDSLRGNRALAIEARTAVSILKYSAPDRSHYVVVGRLAQFAAYLPGTPRKRTERRTIYVDSGVQWLLVQARLHETSLSSTPGAALAGSLERIIEKSQDGVPTLLRPAGAPLQTLLRVPLPTLGHESDRLLRASEVQIGGAGTPGSVVHDETGENRPTATCSPSTRWGIPAR